MSILDGPVRTIIPRVPTRRFAPPANRAERRAERRAARRKPTASELAAAEKAGYVAHGRGVDYRKAGACPYDDKPRIDAWSRGYAHSSRVRQQRG